MWGETFLVIPDFLEYLLIDLHPSRIESLSEKIKKIFDLLKVEIDKII
ncbi:MAG: hypothetical protein U9O59_08130 [Actinomycetota bacterium]|nr:hypothetical protein [Actinomycetota bacterium]